MNRMVFSQSRLTFLFFVVLAFGLRLIYLNQTIKFIQPGSGSDSHFYLQWAEEIVRGKLIGQGVFCALPAYPYFLSLAYFFSGGDILGLLLIQILLGASNCGLIYILGKRLFSNQAGSIAAVISCGYLMLIFYDRMLLPAALSIFLGLLLLLVLFEQQRPLSTKKWFGAGALVGLCALTWAAYLLLAVFILFWMVYTYKQEPLRKIWFGALAFLFPFLLIIGLVTLRNYLVAGEPVVVSAHGGINFYIGNNPQASGLLKSPPYMRPTQSGLIEDAKIVAERLAGKRLKPSQVSQFWFRAAFDFIRSHPLSYLRLLARKFILFWNGQEHVDDVEYQLFNAEAKMARWPLLRLSIVLPLAILGMGLAWPQRARVGLLYLFVFALSLGTILFFINSRYRLMAVPYLIIFSAYALQQLFTRLQEKRFKSLILNLAACLALFFLTNIGLSAAHPAADAGLHYNKGIYLLDQKDWRLCEQEFQTALGLKPDDYLSYFALGNIHYQKREFTEAENNYKNALAINPFFYSVHFNLGIMYEKTGRSDEAEEQFQAVLEFNPRDYAARYNLGRIYQKKGMLEPALREYQLALELEPGHPEVLQALAEMEQNAK